MADDKTAPDTVAVSAPDPAPRCRGESDRCSRQRPLLGEALASADRRHVRACLQGRRGAWQHLVDRYQSLVYSMILDSATGRQDPVALWVTVWREIATRLGEPESRFDLCSWLMGITLEACGVSSPQAAARSVEHLLEAQRLRWCLAELPSRCQEILRCLFAAGPAGSNEELARSLGVPVADWPAVRRVCLDRLQWVLSRHGFL